MQYDQTFHGQICSDHSPRSIRLRCDGDALIFTVSKYDDWGKGDDARPQFTTDLYLDEQDREALAAALDVRVPQFSPVEHVAIGFMAGFALTFIAFVAAWGSV